jgi:hypothetical protein
MELSLAEKRGCRENWRKPRGLSQEEGSINHIAWTAVWGAEKAGKVVHDLIARLSLCEARRPRFTAT